MDKRLSCWLFFWCYYTKVDFATAALQNELRLSLFLQNKRQIFKKMTKLLDFLITFIFRHRAVVKQGYFMRHSLNYANTVLRCSC